MASEPGNLNQEAVEPSASPSSPSSPNVAPRTAPSWSSSANGAPRAAAADARDNEVFSPTPPGTLRVGMSTALLRVREQPGDGRSDGTGGPSSAAAAAPAAYRKGKYLANFFPLSSSDSDSGISSSGDENAISRRNADKQTESKGRRITCAYISWQTIPMNEAPAHYYGNPVDEAITEEEYRNVRNLKEAYSEFRPVRGDGESFYLEQVLGRQDTCQEECPWCHRKSCLSICTSEMDLQIFHGPQRLTLLA